MTRALTLQGGIGLLFAVTGLALLLRPDVARALFRARESGNATYALRIVGAMCFAAGLFLAGFATAFYLAVQP